jgi:hypothetical protein
LIFGASAGGERDARDAAHSPTHRNAHRSHGFRGNVRAMKTIGLLIALTLFAGCKKGGSAASNCSEAVGKGVDKMIAMRQQKLDEQGSALAPELKARMEERSKKMGEVAGELKTAITNRCTEDKWSADVIKCYGAAGSMEELRSCREKLPQDQQAKLKSDEMQVMMKVMGGMGGPPGMGGMPPGHEGMAGHGMGGAPGMAGSAEAGSAAAPAAPAPAGSAAAGSAK